MGNTANLGFGVLNNTNHTLTIALSMAATHYYENNVKPSEIFYRWPGAVHYSVYAYPYADEIKMTNGQAATEIVLASITGVTTTIATIATFGAAGVVLAGWESVICAIEPLILGSIASAAMGTYITAVLKMVDQAHIKLLINGILKADKTIIVDGIKNIVCLFTRYELNNSELVNKKEIKLDTNNVNDVEFKEEKKESIKKPKWFNENIIKEKYDSIYEMLIVMIEHCFDAKSKQYNEKKLHAAIDMIICQLINLIKKEIEFKSDSTKIFDKVNESSSYAVHTIVAEILLKVELLQTYKKPVKMMGCYGGGNGSWIEVIGGPKIGKDWIIKKTKFQMVWRNRKYIMSLGKFTKLSHKHYYTEKE